MRRLIRCSFVLPLLLMSCAYNNPNPKPQLLMKNRWTVSDKYSRKNDEKNMPYVAWWQGFHDATLNQLIAQGIACNNGLGMSRGQIEAAQGELKKIKYQWVPDIDFMAGYSRNPATGFPGVIAVMMPSYTMNLFRQVKQQKQATYALDQVKAEDDAVKLTVISQISASYFTYLAEVEHKQLLQRLANDISSLADIAQKEYKGGLVSDIDMQDLYSQVNLIQGEQETVEQNIVVSRNAIRYLINLNPGEIRTKKRFIALNNRQLMPGSLPLTVLENRPDMQMAENRLRASNQGIGLAASRLLPTVQLDLIGGAIAGNSRYAWPGNGIYFNDQLLQIPALRLSVLGEIAKARGLNKVSRELQNSEMRMIL